MYKLLAEIFGIIMLLAVVGAWLVATGSLIWDRLRCMVTKEDLHDYFELTLICAGVGFLVALGLSLL